MDDKIRGLEVGDDFALWPWQEAAFERLGNDEPLVFWPNPMRDLGKLSPLRHMTASFEQLGSALRRSHSALGAVCASFIIIDELSALRPSPWAVEPLPKKKRDWRPQDQTPPVAVEQRKRAPGVVLMRDRAGNLVERQL